MSLAIWALAACPCAAVSTPAWAIQALDLSDPTPPAIADALQRDLAESFDTAPAGALASSIAPSASARLLSRLRSEGYYGASVRTVPDSAGLVFRVSPGPRFTVASATLSSPSDSTAIQDATQDQRDALIGSPLRAEQILTAEADLLVTLQEQGWPDAQLADRDIVVDHATASARLTFKVVPGPFSRYGALYTDETRWRTGFLQRLNPMPQGEIAQLSGLRTYQARLTALQSVASAHIHLGEPDDGQETRDIHVNLTPAPRYVLDAGISLSTGDGGGVETSLARRNVLGGDEIWTVSAQLQTLEQSLGFDLTTPHWRRLDQSLSVRATLRNEETDAFDQREAELGAEVTRPLTARWTAGVSVYADVSEVTTATTRSDTVTLAAGGSVSFDSRDNTTDPSLGVNARLRVIPTVTYGDLDSSYLATELTVTGYRRVHPQLIAAARARLGSLVGGDLDAIPADDRFYAGGGGSVRGYEYQSLGPQQSNGDPAGGLSVAELGAELRWRGEGRWGAAVFADAGTAASATAPAFDDLRVGLGAGVRYHFDFAPLRLDIAAPVDRRSDEASVHVYVGLGQAF